MSYPLPRFTGQEPCTEVGQEMFFTPENSSALYSHLDQLVSLCSSCSMQAECLDYALHVGVQGVWGGTTEGQRRQMRRALNIIPEPTALAV